MDDPWAYQIRVQVRLDAEWSEWLAGMTISADRAGDGPTVTTITGFAGAAGQAEGRVRRLDDPEQAHQLQPGEVLVAVTTNVGWTPRFPWAAAVITDVGARLSRTAVVARELGIPAVVGCVTARTCLRTGDRVRVDGGRGVVEILETA
jgi:phosphoenolpyruvate synthase/pyruvate phosphate dikinase